MMSIPSLRHTFFTSGFMTLNTTKKINKEIISNNPEDYYLVYF